MAHPARVDGYWLGVAEDGAAERGEDERQQERAERVDVSDGIERDATSALGRVIAEPERDDAVGDLVEDDRRHDDRQADQDVAEVGADRSEATGASWRADGQPRRRPAAVRPRLSCSAEWWRSTHVRGALARRGCRPRDRAGAGRRSAAARGVRAGPPDRLDRRSGGRSTTRPDGTAGCRAGSGTRPRRRFAWTSASGRGGPAQPAPATRSAPRVRTGRSAPPAPSIPCRR